MTIEEISNTLPNGFHDAYIRRLSIDYAAREAAFALEVCIGNSESEDASKRDEYKQGRLKLEGLLYFVIEPPDIPLPEDDILEEGKLWIADDSTDFDELKSYPKLPELNKGFRHWFFISNYNSFIYVAAMNASFEWE